MNTTHVLKAASQDYLGDLISPLSSEEFLRKFWSRQFVYVPGGCGKFDSLFSWSELNSVLERCPIEPPRVRVARDGKDINPQKYLRSFGVPNDERIRRLRTPELMKELRAGATLILNYVEDLSPAVCKLATELEKLFHIGVNVNLYAAFGTENGFNLHWDDQDTLILQVAGRKRWVVYEPTRPYPLREEEEAPPKPNGAAIWDAVLEKGGLFHIPRGWWHFAVPVGEPSVHLTVTVKSVTFIDLLRWFVEGLKRSANVRMNIPVWGTSQEKSDCVESIGREFSQGWQSDLAEQFTRFLDTHRVISHQRMHLPEMAAPNGPTIEATTHLVLLWPLVYEEVEDGYIVLRHNRKKWQFKNKLLPVLKMLSDGGNHTLQEAFALAEEPEDQVAIKDFIGRLVQAGVVTMTERGNGMPISETKLESAFHPVEH